MAKRTVSRQSVNRDNVENSRPVKVVERARRAEYPTITTGGAGVARAERMSTGKGRCVDQRIAAAITWTVTTSTSIVMESSSVRVGVPARSAAISTVTSDATSTNSASTSARAAK